MREGSQSSPQRVCLPRTRGLPKKARSVLSGQRETVVPSAGKKRDKA